MKVIRIVAVTFLGLLVIWGVALGAWVATLATLGLIGMVLWPPERAVRIGLGLAFVVITVGAVETLWCIDQIGAKAREGDLSLRDKVAVYGFNVVFAAAAIPAGFKEFGYETFALGIPWSNAGECPHDRRQAYGSALRVRDGAVPRLRRWSSAMPQRSPRIRARLAEWARTLPKPVAGRVERFGPWDVPMWSWRSYIALEAANRVPVALNSPRTRLSADAKVIDGRWRIEARVDMPVSYPEGSTLQIGPFGLEEGMFHDAQPLLVPYCLEYHWTVWADDPRLYTIEPVRGPFESLSTALLRSLGAHYR
ncbi:MAG: hypothetical protein AAGA48_27540 [Myxococcota bacterium]